MMLIVCVSDYQNKRDYMLITGKTHNEVQSIPRGGLKTTIAAENNKNCFRNFCGAFTLKRLRLPIDSISAYYLLREIREFTQFRIRIVTNPALQQMKLLWLQLVPPAKEIIDYKWNCMLTYTLWEKIEVDYLMSWLSTLGGGFSALGEQFSKCAETAGKISLRQLAIGMRVGDPFLQARCKLYYSLSLIQTGRLKAAKHIVRQQYKFAIKQKEIDGRLVKMCRGIWHRIQYEYELRLKDRDRIRVLRLGAGDVN